MQFKVPQFLDIEDKIFGPFTFKQFAYLTGGAGICYVLYELLGLLIGAIPILLVAGLSGMLTFYRPNGKPFITMLESSVKYAIQNKLYIWEKRQIKKDLKIQAEMEAAAQSKEKAMAEGNRELSRSKLRDLAWSLDVLDTKKQNN